MDWLDRGDEEMSEENRDVGVIFLHPPGPARSFSWPSRKDYCWVPCNKVLMIVNAPKATPTGRVYHIEDRETCLGIIFCVTNDS